MRNIIINLEDYISEDKPYNKCVFCQKLGQKCDGPNFLAMTNERWVEWCKLRKDYLGWSNADLAARCPTISKPTIDRTLSGHGGDVRTSTKAEITKALVNGTWGQFPCADPNPSAHDPAQHKEAEMLRGEKEYLKRIVDDLQNSIKWYKDSLKWHKWVIVILGIIVFLAVVAIIVDLAIGDIGWIRY